MTVSVTIGHHSCSRTGQQLPCQPYDGDVINVLILSICSPLVLEYVYIVFEDMNGYGNNHTQSLHSAVVSGATHGSHGPGLESRTGQPAHNQPNYFSSSLGLVDKRLPGVGWNIYVLCVYDLKVWYIYNNKSGQHNC